MMSNPPLFWLLVAFVCLVHWLAGHLVARIGAFLLMVVAVCLLVFHEPESSFTVPAVFFGALVSWFLSGIPRRYRKRRDAQPTWTFTDYAAELRAQERIADREIQN